MIGAVAVAGLLLLGQLFRSRRCRKAPESTSSLLLALPEPLLHEVFSWSPDDDSTHALLRTCRATHRLRRDPAAMTLLLMRRRCQDYKAILASCAGAVPARLILRQLLCLLRPAGPESGGPYTAPPPLLQAALWYACAAGDAAGVRALLATPLPLDLSGTFGCDALKMAVRGRHLGVLQALLDGGANPMGVPTSSLSAICVAAHVAGGLPALQLLLQHTPAAARPAAAAAALEDAISQGWSLETLAYLLPRVAAIGHNNLSLAAERGDAVVLQLLLQNMGPGTPIHPFTLVAAIVHGHTECVALLIDSGADVNAGAGLPLMAAVKGHAAFAVAEEVQLGVLALLLQRGAVVREDVLTAAEEAGRDDLLALLAQHAAAAEPAQEAGAD